MGRPRVVERPLSCQDRRRVEREANRHLGEALALSTWRSLESTHRRFLEFIRNWEDQEGYRLPTSTALILWVEKMMSLDQLSVQSALTYAYNVISAEKRFRSPIPMTQQLRDFIRSLRRRGAMRPSKQAVPATKEQVVEAISREPCSKTALALMLAWRGAARVGDVVRLRCADIKFVDEQTVVVQWADTKDNPFHLQSATGVFLPHRHRRLLERLAQSTQRGDLLFPGMTTSMFSRALKRVDPSLSAHSIRRGALQHLAGCNVPLEELRQLSRHTTLQGLLHYVPPATTQHARSTAALSRML